MPANGSQSHPTSLEAWAYIVYTRSHPTPIAATPGSFFQAPFIYNILWAIIEPPVFILAGSLLTLGPYFRGKYGPVSVFRSLRSTLFSYTGRSTTSTSVSKSGNLDQPRSYGELSSGSDRKPWVTASTISDMDDTETRRSLELGQLGETSGSRGKQYGHHAV